MLTDRRDAGRRVRELRRAAGLSQQALADAAGVSRVTVSSAEGGAGLRAGTLRSLCAALGVSLDAVGPSPSAAERPGVRQALERAAAALEEAVRLMKGEGRADGEP